MKHWVQFTITRNEKHDDITQIYGVCKPYQWDLLGSDGVAIFDGRYNLDSIINECYKRIEKSKKITGFKIYKGDFLNENNLLYKMNPNK